jgi:hypothetical protein
MRFYLQRILEIYANIHRKVLLLILRRWADGSSKARRNMRITLAILGPLFVLSGVLGILGIGGGTTYSNGREVTGAEAKEVSLIFLLIGIIFCVMRFYFMRNKPDSTNKRP